MSKFVCRNKDCKKYGIEDEHLRNTYTMIDGHLVSANAPCPCCGKVREEINEAANIPISEKNLMYGEYSSASPEQKREMLKKRSHEHFEKYIKESKEEKINAAVKAFKNV